MTDLHVLATIIKVWFRMMPVKLLSVVSPAEITSCSTGAQCMQVLQRFPAAHKGVVLWLLDLMADVADQQESNKMNERALAIVMAPNLYDAPATDNPLDALMQARGVHTAGLGSGSGSGSGSGFGFGFGFGFESG